MLKGKAVSSGIGIGPALLWLAVAPDVWEAGSQALADHEVDAEAQRLEVAVAAARVELHAIRNDVAARLGRDGSGGPPSAGPPGAGGRACRRGSSGPRAG